jgi:dihydropteroate synthase
MINWQLPDRMIAIGRRPLIMGIVNVTPDSFSDGGQYSDHQSAIAHGRELVAQGADILDVGGESTRPGANPVSVEEELRRVIPVISALAAQVAVPISVDTSKAEVARQALAVGAHILNDVTGLTGDPAMPQIARDGRAGIILMHMQGTPQTMQLAPHYDNVVAEVHAYLEERLAALTAVGIEAERLAIDPGIGFGKTLDHNLELLANLAAFRDLGRPICLGVSRKGFINKVLGLPGKVEPGSGGTLGVLLFAAERGAVQIARVHDVSATRAALTLYSTLSDRMTSSSGDEARR